MQIVNSLAPVFLLIGLGALLVRAKFLQRDFLRGMNDLAYWIGLPMLIFRELARADLRGDGFSSMMLVFLGGTLIAMAASVAAAYLLRLPRESRGTFIQAGFRGNLAFIGLPVLIFAFNDLPNKSEAILSGAVLVLAPAMILYNVAAVFALHASHAAGWTNLIKKTARQLSTNPLILASLAGIAAAHFQISLPSFLDRSVEALSRLALPLALLCIGGTLVTVPIQGSLGKAISAALIKVAVAPLGGLAVGLLFGIDRYAILAALTYLACPTAAASYVLARQLGGDQALAASAIVISTLLSLLSLSVVVAML